MNWKLPNQLTVLRLLLAIVFFALLALYEGPGGAPAGEQAQRARLLLNVCFGLFILAGITDILDGYLARRMKAVSAFGRITDPVVDKVLICGAYALLTGSNFFFSAKLPMSSYEQQLPGWITGNMASGVQAWMVVVILAREFVVSGVRGYSESRGQSFPATVYGKLKMFTQSVAIGAVLYQLANLPETPWAIITKLTAVWASVLATVFSGLAYVSKARKLMISDE